MRSYDNWLTSPPEYPDPRVLAYCSYCECELVEGDEVSIEDDRYYCSKGCYRDFVIEHLDDYINDMYDMSVSKVILEADEQDYDEY